MAVATHVSSQANAEVWIEAEAYPTPGVPNFTTYDLIARSNEGILNAYDFSNHNGATRGITGPLYQVGGVYTSQLNDSGWLADPTQGIDLGVSESESALYGIYAFKAPFSQENTRTSWKFVRLVTESPVEVQLIGQFAIKPFGGTALDAYIVNLSLSLADVAVVPEPTTVSLLGLALWRAWQPPRTLRQSRG